MGRKPKSQEERVSNRIEVIRIGLGMSRQQLADLLGVHYQTVGYIERGEYLPSLVLALQISKALATQVEDIFRLEEEIN
jgi:DNA-binding XRE family transcriptional regulator